VSEAQVSQGVENVPGGVTLVELKDGVLRIVIGPVGIAVVDMAAHVLASAVSIPNSEWAR
jgi:hypothetical protein